MRKNTLVRAALVVLSTSLAFVAGCGFGRDGTADASLPDDAGVIVFNLSAGDDLRSIRPDGTRLQPFELRASCDPMDFSPDGRIVACSDASIPREPLGIYVMRRDGSGWRRVPLPSGYGHSPSLSPDARELVFLYSRDEFGKTFELWKAGIDGEEAKRLAAGDNAEPAWSPDGTRIAFIRDPPEWISAGECFEADLVVVDADGGEPRLLAEESAMPEWSPDGKRLAFISDCDTISTVSAEGGPPTVLARQAWAPVWSPDGKRIAFLRETGPCGHATCLQRIFVIPATGGKPRAVGPHVFDPFAFFWLPSSATASASDN